MAVWPEKDPKQVASRKIKLLEEKWKTYGTSLFGAVISEDMITGKQLPENHWKFDYSR